MSEHFAHTLEPIDRTTPPNGIPIVPPAGVDAVGWLGDVVQRVGTLAEAVTGAVGELARSQRAVLDAIDALRPGGRGAALPAPAAPVEPARAGTAHASSSSSQSHGANGTYASSHGTHASHGAHSAASRDLSPEPREMGPYFEEVRRIVSEAMRDREQTLDRSAARDRYVRQRMADLPDAYRRQMPDTDDPDALSRGEQAVRRQFRDDFKRAGGTDPDVSGDASGGRRPGAAIDYSKLSPLQQITLGLKDAPPAGAAAVATTTATRDPAEDAQPAVFAHGAD